MSLQFQLHLKHRTPSLLMTSSFINQSSLPVIWTPSGRLDSFREDVAAVGQWSHDNYLTLNPTKCKCMLISRRRSTVLHNVSLHLNGHSLEQVQTFKCMYLGVTLSSDLSWSYHMNRVCNKARQVLGVLYRRFYPDCNTAILVQLFTSPVRPHLEYGYPAWSPYTSKDISKLDKVQKFALRMGRMHYYWSTK